MFWLSIDVDTQNLWAIVYRSLSGEIDSVPDGSAGLGLDEMLVAQILVDYLAWLCLVQGLVTSIHQMIQILSNY